MTEEQQRMMKLATHLRDIGKLDPLKYRVWKLHTEGYTFFAIRQMLIAEYVQKLEEREPAAYNEPEKEFDEGRIRGVHTTTLARWYDRVQVKLEAVQDTEKEGRPLLGLTLERNGEVEFVIDTVVREVLR